MIFKKISEAGIFLQSVIILILLALHLFTPAANLGFSTAIYQSIPLFHSISNLKFQDNFFLLLASLLIYLVFGLLFNIMFIRNELTPKQSIFSTLIFFVFILLATDTSVNIATPVVLVLLLIAFYNMLKMYAMQNAYSSVMNAAISVSAASLFYPQAIIFIFFIWFSFFTLRISSWREWIISFIGLITPYFYFITYLFLVDKLPEAYAGYKLFFANYLIDFNSFGLWEGIALILPVLILLLSIPAFISDAGERIIAIRKKMWLTLNFLWLSLIILLVSGKAAGVWLPVFFIPASLIVSHRIVTRRRSWPSDVLLFVFILLIILLRMNL